MLKNAKHEKFAQAVALGDSAAEAYRLHVSGGKCSPATAETEGPALARKPQIALRIEVLRGNAAAKCEMTRDEAVKMCVDILRSAPSQASMDNPLCELRMSKMGPFAAFPDKGRIMERLAKMTGWDEPEKHQLEVKVVIGGNADGHS